MKTSKLSYIVEVQNEKGIWKSVECVTLAEARLIASRAILAVIKPVGKIEYAYGKEIQDFNLYEEMKKDFEKTFKKNT